ncbi:MAG: MotA/TolQ/ExbB proton channel family protein [Hydrocarboniphaga sp.]|nr:MotA/TolQ/ExbB proton channel family protein [Hydrocarboniphaga sp.]
MSKTNADREARFLRDKSQQAALLAEAEGARSAADARAKSAKGRFDGAQAGIAALKQQLEGRVGDSAQIFSAVSEAAGSFRAQAADSLVTPQFPDRLAQLDALAQARELPGVDQLEQLWLLYAQEIAEGGKVARFKAEVFDDAGAPQQAEVTRIGLFTAFAEGRYLALQPDTGKLAALARQPGHTGLIDDFGKGEDELAPMLVDPSRGALLRRSAERPSLSERIEQGGAVGYVIICIGVIGAVLAIYQLIYLLRVDALVRSQLRQIDRPRNDNPLGRVLASIGAGDQADALLLQDPEVLETRLSEAILRETPRLERYQSLLKMIVAAGPLLGLLGTVIGMILTFQVITELGAGDPKVMAGGISQAMIATVLGLIIAIPLLFANSFLGSRSRALTQVLDEQAAGLLARHLEAHRGITRE